MYERSERAETKGEYYHRQIMATTNFVPFAKLDLFLQETLEEVDFPNPPDFRVFYAALDTHLEHHMFPDLPDNRLREIVPEVQEIFERYGLPYNIVNFEKTVPDIVGRLLSRTAPVANTQETVWGLLKKPTDLTQRLFYGMTYRKPEEPYYMGVLREDKTQTIVVESSNEIGGQARTFRFAIPEKWKKMKWDAGSFISVEVEIDGKKWIRQYSLTHPSEVAETLDITVKRVKDGKVSNYLNDNLKKGDTITLFRKPQGEEGFVMEGIPDKPLFIAGGVGVTPILSMIRKIANEAPETDASFLYFNRDEEGVLFRDELERLSKTTGLDLRLIFDPLPDAPKHLETSWISKELLEKHVPDLLEREVYICAPDGFISKTKGYLRELGYDMGRFHMEMFKPPEVKKDQNASYVYHTVKFLKSGKEVRINENTTLLDASRKAGVPVLTGCEKGLCKACVCPKTLGVTQLEGENPDEFLSKITICNTLPRSDIELDI
jgi:ferredoxin-NADP reductase